MRAPTKHERLLADEILEAVIDRFLHRPATDTLVAQLTGALQHEGEMRYRADRSGTFPRQLKWQGNIDTRSYIDHNGNVQIERIGSITIRPVEINHEAVDWDMA